MTTLVTQTYFAHFYNRSLHFQIAEEFHLRNYIITLKQSIRRFNIYTAENNSEFAKKYIYILDTLLDARNKKLVTFSDKLLNNKELAEMFTKVEQTIEHFAIHGRNKQQQPMTRVVKPKKG